MKDYMALGPVPCNESCQQVGTREYDHDAAKAECRRYRDMLLRRFPIPESKEGINAFIGYFVVKSFPHDFGDYMEVCAVYDDDDPESVRWMIHVEHNLPATWDDDAVIPMDMDMFD